MPQRMQGYTEFRGTPWPPAGAVRVPAEPAPPVHDDVEPLAAVASPEVPVAAPVAAVPAGVPAPAQPAVADETAPQAVVPVPAPVAAVAAPVEPGRRMAGYTAFRGSPWPPAVGGQAPAVPVPSAAPAATAPVAATEAAPAGASTPAPAMTADPVAASDREAPAFTPGRRMAGYTAFQGAPWPPVAAPALPAGQAAVESAAAEPATVASPLVEATAADVAAPVAIAAASADAPATPPTAATAAPAERTREAPPASATPSPAASAPRAATGSPNATSVRPAKTLKAAASGDAAGPSLRRRLAVAVGGVVVLGLLAVLGARWLVTLPAVAEFVARYPGVPALPEATPVGVPAWLAWQHFLNAFLMVLIIRTGLQVRGETRPPANFTPKKPGFFAPPGSTGKKFSLTIWIHQALDVLWLLNGLVFVVLLAATGHWRRLIPLDPATPQHMASTALQYLTLDWPAHDGWLHYNALQMVAYAGVVFILAPLAAITGYRMSSWWPADNAALSRAFPMEAARRLHFPTMIAISAFIVVHVLLVLFSGVLHNLNAMFLARDAADAWGLVAFLVAAAATAAAWVLLKPAFISPVAERFGRVGR